MNLVRSLLRSIARLPPVKWYRQAAYRRRFFAPGTSWPRFYGLFESRDDALSAAARGSNLVGYDHAEVAGINLDAMASIWTSDYPVLFWLSGLLSDQRELFDLGGHVGTKYLAWRNYLHLPADFTWRVCDLPSIVEAGKEMSKDIEQLQFTTDRQDADGTDILLISGVLQYADFNLAEMLKNLSHKPRHLLINKLPTHDREDLYTLENLIHSVVPYRIFDQAGFLRNLENAGYSLVDRWTVPESSVRVPFTDLGKPTHFGFYLRCDASEPA
jgi:putative methyltransferase (TIGR04325 family)